MSRLFEGVFGAAVEARGGPKWTSWSEYSASRALWTYSQLGLRLFAPRPCDDSSIVEQQPTDSLSPQLLPPRVWRSQRRPALLYDQRRLPHWNL